MNTSSPPNRSPLSYLYTHNPFYAISAVLMLYAVRTGFGELEIGMINSWAMMAVLSGYTLVLGLIVMLIVRKGAVWEDARSILLLMLLLFLGISISFDDLFVRAAPSGANALLASGFLFSALLSELVLLVCRMKLGVLYRIPYYLMLALFYAAPWFCSQGIDSRDFDKLEWVLLAFPVVAGLLFLLLIPAVHSGAKYVKQNGTPWQWPHFPGIAFGVIAAAVSLRSFVLCLTFSPRGMIWQELGSRSISFDTMWGPYFLIPFVLALLVLLMEAGLAARNRSLQFRLLCFAPLLLLMAFPTGDGYAHLTFLDRLTTQIGAPLWLTVWLLIGFFSYALLRGVVNAKWGIALCVGLLTTIGPQSIHLQALTTPDPVPLLVVSLLLLGQGIWNRSSFLCALGATTAAISCWIWLPMISLEEYKSIAAYRFYIVFNQLWLSLLVIGFSFRDDYALYLRKLTALMLPVVALAVLFTSVGDEFDQTWQHTYVLGCSGVSLCVAALWVDKWFLMTCTSSLMLTSYSGLTYLYREMAVQFGRAAMSAFAWSLAALIIAFLISAHKANWLGKRNGSYDQSG